MRIFAAQPATDTTINHRGDRVDFQWIRVVFQCQRRTSRQPYTGMVAIANIFIHTVLDTHHALTCRSQRVQPGPHAALALKLAFAFGDEDLQAAEFGSQRFFEHIAHRSHTVGMHNTQPLHAQSGECLLYRMVAGSQTRKFVCRLQLR